MDYNPFTEEHKTLTRDVSVLSKRTERLSIDLKWYEGTSTRKLSYQLKADKLAAENCMLSLKSLVADMGASASSLAVVRAQCKSIFNPFSWFDGSQKFLRNKIKSMKAELAAQEKIKAGVIKTLYELENEVGRTKQAIEKYKYFEKDEAIAELNSINIELVPLRENLSRVEKKRNAVDEVLNPLMRQIKELEHRLTLEHEIIALAKSFESELALATNSYERAMIHEKSEKHLKNGRPKQVVVERERIVNKIGRDLEKLKQRVKQVVERASRDVRKVVIDGNNLCYEDSRFVGVEPLLKITEELQTNLEVIIIFDAGIRGLLKAGDKEIRSKFNPRIKVHIVATRTQADETILSFTADDKYCYVLSNDRFVDFKEKEVVQNNRLIRHEILSGRVIVHDFGINVEYAAC